MPSNALVRWSKGYRLKLEMLAAAQLHPLSEGSQIPIEERDTQEVYQVGETRIFFLGRVDFYNPAFDFTPAQLIRAIITEKGAVSPDKLIQLKPYMSDLKMSQIDLIKPADLRMFLYGRRS